MRKRHSGMFKPGQSGNPSGRPKMEKTIRDLARAHTREAILTLAEIARNPKSSDSARVQACNAILDRGWGKPSQYMETKNVNMTIDDILTQVSVEQKTSDAELAETEGKKSIDPFKIT
jgi:hypothetical protein